MNHSIGKSATAIAAAFGLAITAAAQEITPVEKDDAVRYLAESRNELVASGYGLSEAQWKFKSAPDCWSIADVVEHLAVLEDVFANNLSAQVPADKPGARRDSRNQQRRTSGRSLSPRIEWSKTIWRAGWRK